MWERGRGEGEGVLIGIEYIYEHNLEYRQESRVQDTHWLTVEQMKTYVCEYAGM